MYRDGKQFVTTDVHNFVMNNAALGDMISSLPAVIFARKFYPTEPILRVWIPPWQHELVEHLLAPYGKFEIRDMMKFPFKASEREGWRGPDGEDKDQAMSYNGLVFDQHTRCRVHMVDYAFGCLINARPETMEQRCYPTKAPLGPIPHILHPYVVFPVGATSDNKLFRASVMGPIMRWCQSSGYSVVITGTKTSHTQTQIDGVLKPIVLREQTDMLPSDVMASIIDMREKTTLLQLRDLLGYAAAVVGVDGGTMHLAGTTDVPIVFASGTTLPKHRYIPRHGSHEFRARYVGPRDLECAGCQSNWPMTTMHFTKCAYDDNLCMEKLHPDDFIAGLKELGL